MLRFGLGSPSPLAVRRFGSGPPCHIGSVRVLHVASGRFANCLPSVPCLIFWSDPIPIPIPIRSDPIPLTSLRVDLISPSLARSDPSSTIVAFLFATLSPCAKPRFGSVIPCPVLYSVRAHSSDPIRKPALFFCNFSSEHFTPFDDVFDHSIYSNQSQSIPQSHSNK